jgi:GxxExxY protein
LDEPGQTLDEIARQIVDAAFAVHVALGPGLLESVYEQCLTYELQSRSLIVARQLALPVRYREITIDAGFRVDLLVNDLIVVEIKAVEKMLPVHEAQLLTYLKLSGKRLGLLINFNVPRIKDGIKRLLG